MQSFAGREYAEPEAALLDFFDDAGAPPAVVLHLPSRTGLSYAGAANDLYELNREVIHDPDRIQSGLTIRVPS